MDPCRSPSISNPPPQKKKKGQSRISHWWRFIYFSIYCMWQPAAINLYFSGSHPNYYIYVLCAQMVSLCVTCASIWDLGENKPLLLFIVISRGLISTNVPISLRLTSLALGRYDPRTAEAIMKNVRTRIAWIFKEQATTKPCANLWDVL